MDRQTRHSLHHTLRCQSTWYACESRISRTARPGRQWPRPARIERFGGCPLFHANGTDNHSRTREHAPSFLCVQAISSRVFVDKAGPRRRTLKFFFPSLLAVAPSEPPHTLKACCSRRRCLGHVATSSLVSMLKFGGNWPRCLLLHS